MGENEGLILQTERLILREFSEDDWQAVHEYASDPEAVKYMVFGPNTERDTRDHLKKVMAHQKEQPRQAYNIALVNRNEDRLIGACALTIRSAESQQAELGYVLNRRYWNQGYMTEAGRAVVSFGFEKLGLHRIFATCHPANTGSYRVMEKIGMLREGYLRENSYVKGNWRDCLLYSILEDEWRGEKEELLKKTEAKIEYIEMSLDGLDAVRPLWDKLTEHHKNVSRYFKESRSDINFEMRKYQLLKKSETGDLRVDLVKELNRGEYIGYCLTSLTAEKHGEIESIYVEKDYRGSGIGDQLMTRALGWLESNAVKRIILGVAEGNESVFNFYRRYNFYPRTTILEKKPGFKLKEVK